VIKNTVGSDWFYKALGKLQGVPLKPTAFTRLLWKIHHWGKEKRYYFSIRPVLNCQVLAAEQILKRRYGITPREGDSHLVTQEWEVWVAVLGKPIPGFRESYLTMRTLLGCGIAGLLAMRIESVLQNRYFGFMSALFVFAGGLAAWDFAKKRYQPKRSSIVRLIALLRELAGTQPVTINKKEADEVGFEDDGAARD
jgi:hypothetical protein